MTRPRLVALALGFAVSPLLLIAYAWAVTSILDRDFATWARHDAAFEMTRSLDRAVDLYRRDNHRSPSEQEGLAVLVPKYTRTIPVDPWGNPFVYRAHGGDWADVVSLGADGADGGSGLAADVSARYGSSGTAPPRALVGAIGFLLLAIPLAAYTASYWRPEAAAALAGDAVFWAWVAAATVAPNAAFSTALAAALAAVLVALLGAVLTLRRLRGGPTTALIGALGCLTASAAMMG
jgi:general secretion pathway protein G